MLMNIKACSNPPQQSHLIFKVNHGDTGILKRRPPLLATKAFRSRHLCSLIQDSVLRGGSQRLGQLLPVSDPHQPNKSATAAYEDIMPSSRYLKHEDLHATLVTGPLKVKSHFANYALSHKMINKM